MDMISKKRRESFSRKGTKNSEDIPNLETNDYFERQLIDEPSRNEKKMATMVVDI